MGGDVTGSKDVCRLGEKPEREVSGTQKERTVEKAREAYWR